MADALFLQVALIEPGAQVRGPDVLHPILFQEVPLPRNQGRLQPRVHKGRVSAGMVIMAMAADGVLDLRQRDVQLPGVGQGILPPGPKSNSTFRVGNSA